MEQTISLPGIHSAKFNQHSRTFSSPPCDIQITDSPIAGEVSAAGEGQDDVFQEYEGSRWKREGKENDELRRREPGNWESI